MFFSFLRRVILIGITLVILSFISYHILMRDPLNQVLAVPHFYSGYWNYIQSLASGDWGITYHDGESLQVLLFTVLPPTLELCFTAMLFAMLFGIPLGLVSAYYSQNFIGKTINCISLLGLSLPVFWLAPILLYVAAFYHWEISAVGQFNLLYEIKPITGFPLVDMWFVDEPYRLKIIQNVLQHLVLPTLVLMIFPMMEITRLTQQRAGYLFAQNFVKITATLGWSKFKMLRKRILRNTIPIIVPHFARISTLVLTHCMLIEDIFGWPGIGRWLINAVTQQDYNSIAAGVIVIGLFVIIINILTNLACFILDPFNRKGWYAK